MKVIIRVDASVEIGTGHVMRCITLAEELRNHNFEINFITRNHKGNLIKFIQQKGFTTHILPSPQQKLIHKSDYASWLGDSQINDAKQSLSFLQKDEPYLLIVDHYGIDTIWETLIRPHVTWLTVIDDLANRKHLCDILVDQNWYAKKTKTRYANLVPEHCNCLLGPQYSLLTPEYANFASLVPPHKGILQRILVFLGGSDPDNVTGKIIQSLMSPIFRHLIVDIVIGINHPCKEEIELQAEQRAYTYVHYNLPSLAGLMIQSDLMIGAGGSTTWERLCLGTPSLTVTIADNQREYTKALSVEGYISYLGDISSLTPSSIAHTLELIIKQPQKLQEQSNKGKKLVPGNGSQMVTKELLKYKDYNYNQPTPTLLKDRYSILILSDHDSWIAPYILSYSSDLKNKGHIVQISNSIKGVNYADICFFLSFGQLVPKDFLSRHKHNLVVHESDLPHGKGWSPLTWQVLEGKSTIPVTLFEATEKVDSGVIYCQKHITLEGHELISEIRQLQAKTSLELCNYFISNYPSILKSATLQNGKESFYPRRTKKNSKLDPEMTIAEQFNLLRVVDNTRYPAFFTYRNHTYLLKIERDTQL